MTEEQFEKLKEKLNNTNFSSYKKKYDNPNLTDLPSTFITYKGRQVQVRIWKNVPDQLIDVHEYLEGILLKKHFF